jgi:hypothetical protein
MEANERFAKFLSELENPKLDGTNPHFRNRYTTLKTALEVVPLLSKYGLYVNQTVRDNGMFTTSIRDIESDHTMASASFPFIVGKEDPQGLGSAITYSRRYGLLLVLNLVGEEDDDGEAAMGRPVTTQRKKVRR